MKYEDYPALYRSADISSSSAQKRYLSWIKAQYAIFILSALFVLLISVNTFWIKFYVASIICSACLLLYMGNKKPEKDWYGCRALAESVKTATWRYMMKAEPFEKNNSISVVRQRFSEYLNDIIKGNNHVKEPLSRNPQAGDQITKKMESIQKLSLKKRKDYYKKYRIADQKKWYVSKTKQNNKLHKVWVGISIFLHVLSLCMAFIIMQYPLFWQYTPIEVLIICSAAALGWAQIKKFNELASAYSLTAHEIGIVQSKLDTITKEKDFSEFVNEAEQAFSREHTQWVARQTEQII